MTTKNQEFFNSYTRKYPTDELTIESTGTDAPALVKDNTVLFKFTLHKVSFQKQANEAIVEGATDQEMYIKTKRLIDHRFLKPIDKVDSAFRAEVDRISVGASYLGKGTYLIPIRAFSLIQSRIAEFQEDRNEKIQDLIDVYEEAIEDARSRLGDGFVQSDYLSPDLIKSKFTMSYNYWEVQTPDNIKLLDRVAYSDAVSKVSREMAESINVIQQGLRAGLKELVDSLYDKVSKMDTERKVFRAGFVANIRSFLELADAKNFIGDTELSGLVSKARAMLDGVTPEDLQTDAGIRIELENGLSTLASEVDDMIINKPIRQFEL